MCFALVILNNPGSPTVKIYRPQTHICFLEEQALKDYCQVDSTSKKKHILEAGLGGQTGIVL